MPTRPLDHTRAPAPGGHTVGRWVSASARLAPGRIAVDERGRLLTYRELDDRSSALAEALRAAGYRRGDRVATLTRSSTDHVVAFFACAKAALVLAPLSWRLAGAELADLVAHCRPALLLASAELEGAARAAASASPTPPPLALLGPDGVESAVPARGASVGPAGADAPTPDDDEPRTPDDEPPGASVPADEDPVLLLYTSGSTGRPRGVLLTHANCYWTNASLGDATGMTSQDVVLGIMPQFHSGGWNVQPLLAWRTGATVVLEPDFDPGAVIDLLSRRRVTTMMGVPAHYRMLAEHPDFASADLHGLTHAIVGGAPMPHDLLAVWQSRGVRVFQGYGLTEAAPNVLVLPAEEAGDHVGSVGRPYAHVEVALLTGGEVHHGAGTGELLVRGPAVFAGYADDPEATRAAFHDGWLRTGDLAERDDAGYVRIVDRRSAMYITGGENVSPAQVESVLRAHPGIADVAVVGVPDTDWGEVGHAVVVARPGADLDARSVVAHARESLAAYKCPRYVTFVDELPRITLLKVDRARLPLPSGDPVGPRETRSDA
ncbi:class I adenylate-forming enzyme family protein [Georgenia sp. Z1344]|uniref:class I adenylate-forming enzyme family protein n=1 Tax=Georgenia sp. Z1344 TaxID=3416706 RepID=UPI003CF3AEA5